MTSREPFFSCPRYSSCNVNNCPLSTQYPDGVIDPEDPEKKCTLPKSYRLRVSAMFPGVLPFDGLTPREFKGRSNWESKTPEEQANQRTRLKKIGFVSTSQNEKESLGHLDGDDFL